MSVVETTRVAVPAQRWLRYQGLAILTVLVILVGLAYAFNLIIVEDIRSRYPDSTLTPLYGLMWSLLYSGSIGAVAIAFTKVLTMSRNVSWRSLVECYLMASGWHVLGGLYALYLWQSGGWPGPGESVLINLNVFDWGGRVGHFLKFVSIDELLHLVTYIALVSNLAGWRKAWWFYAALLTPWLAYTWFTNSLRL